MSKVKRYNPELEKEFGLGLPCLSMLGNPYGEWVHYQDYAELKAQRDALAAENAARGEIIERLIGQYSAAGYHAVQNSLNPAQSLLYDAMQVMKQPATAAYLNSVRADAVASFAHHQRVISDSETDPTIQRGHRITACRAEGFAAQLRAGKDGE
ncbi:hypothetical protein [Pantoea sp. M_5]|uniref:hypothetical protein n=1 Tax=Pantoea sp. M_5 TaxID=2608038 RepID=UPI0012329923|nr:hypothetical protein [Pantoea sp. M_5]KAA6001442.1 hypothetical protein F3I50_03610 [Pantoea sp. M_5]